MKHIRILVLILCACLVSVAWSQQKQTCKADTPWEEFHRHNMERWNPCEHVLNVHNVGGLHVKWHYTTGNGNNGGPTSAALANGVVYVGSYPSGIVYALNARTGTSLWSYQTGGGIVSSPAVVNGVVYIGSRDNNVYALNASTGALLWSYTTGGYVDSSPAVANGVVYVGSNDSNVYALNASTGAVLWRYTTGGYVPASPAVTNGVVYVSSEDGNMYALNASTGTLLWSYPVGGGYYGYLVPRPP